MNEIFFDTFFAIALSTLECEINMPAGINVPAGNFYKNNKIGKFD